MIFYRISELMLPTLIQRYDKNHFIFDPVQKRETNWNFTGSQMSHFMIVLILYINLLNLSSIKLEMCQHYKDATAVGDLTIKLQNSTWYKCLNRSLNRISYVCTYVHTFVQKDVHSHVRKTEKLYAPSIIRYAPASSEKCLFFRNMEP